MRKWKNRSNWKFTVYEEKFTYSWENFCLDNDIGIRTNEGLLLPEELAFIYMTYLAKEVAFNESAAIITDNNRFDDFTNYSRATRPTIDRRNQFAKGIISLLVPNNINDLSFEKVIRFRNKNRPLIRAFNQELDNMQQKIGIAYAAQDFINSYNKIYSELNREVILMGIGVAAIPFAAYILIQNPLAKTPEYIKEILGGLGVILGGGYSLNRNLKDTKNKRFCKKYFTNLKHLE